MDINHDSPGKEQPQEERRSTPKRKWGTALIFLFVMFLLFMVGRRLIKVQAGQVSSGPAPDFTLIGFTGEKVTLSEQKGNVVVINFWASWCPPCREEAEYLEATWRKYQDQGIVFIGVDYADTEKEALAYIEEFDITYFNGPDLGTRISQAYNMQGVPETFVVGKDGIIRYVHVGPIYYPTLDEKIEELLGEKYEE